MCKKMICLISLALLLGLSSSLLAQTYPGKIGVGAGLVWVDIVKQQYRFQKADGSELSSGDVDASGWPTCDAQYVFDGRPVAEWEGAIDDPEQYRVDMSGTYTCSFNGQATLSRIEGPWTIQSQSYNSGTNTTTFEIVMDPPGPHHGLIVMTFTNTQRTSGSGTNTGFTNLKIIRPGYPHDTTQLFDTPYLDCLNSADFAALRGCGSAYCINDYYPAVRNWSDRRMTTDAGQSGQIPGHKMAGAAWEYVVQFVNTLQKDAWIHVPVDATDDYVTQLATLLKNNLNSNLNLYVEYDNEVWNWGFPQSLWNLDAANAAGLNYITQYAKRTVEVSNIFKNVWGASAINDRVRVVLCWQIGWWPPDGQQQEQLNYINDNYGPPSNFLWGCGWAPYHNCDPVCTTGTAQEILDAMWVNSNDGIESKQLVIAVANSWGLKSLLYEAGSDTGGGDTTNIANKIAAERAPGMKDVMIHDMRDNWFPLGGDLVMYLAVSSGYNRYGSWGLTDDYHYPDRNYKFEAIRELIGDVGGLPGQASNPSPGNGATGVSINADLSWSAGSDATSHDVYFGQDSTPDSGEFQGNQGGTTFNLGTLANDATYYWRIDSVNAAGTTTGTVWSFTTESAGGGLPSPWVNGDVGSPSQAGTASESSGTFTIEGGGSDIWGTYDSFHYVYQSLSGDGEISARVASVENTDSWAKAGVMIREALTGGSTHAMMAITAGNGAAFQRRTSTDGSSDHTAGASVTAPYWVRLVRSGDTLTGYQSSDGSGWSEVGSATVAMATDVYIGLAVTAHNDGTLCTSDMSNVTVSGGGPPPPPAAPTNLSATPGDGQVALNWGGSASADNYNVYRGTGGNYYWQASPTSTSWTDTSVTNGTTYWYYVTAENAGGESGQSNTVSATPQAAGPGPGNGTGLTGDYYDNMDFTAFALTRTDATVNFNWGSGSPDPAIGADTFSVQWTGQVEPMYSETYTFYTTSDDGVRLWVNAQLIIDNWTDHGPTENSGTIALTAGVKYDISMDFYENGGGAVAELRWSSASQAYEIIPQTQLYPAEAGGTGTILREWWTGISGNAISELTSSPDYPDNPSGSDEPTSFEAPTDWADSYGTRISGYLHPTDSGDYTFWIASDDNGELWLSTNDNPANASLIANVPGWSSSRQWDKYAEQQSSAISLTGGNVYYIEALQKEGGGGDNLAVAWQGPGISQQVIDGDFLSPWAGGGPLPPGQASNPSPADGATGINIDADVSWTAGADATSHDVYFGQSTSPPFIQNQAGTTYDPGTLSEATTYYWRIDEVGAGGTTTGTTWSFTTGSTAPPGVLVAWEFAGDGGASSASAETIAANISGSAPSGVASIGPGLSPIDYIGDALTGTQSTAMTLAEALTADDYLSWTIAPTSGHSMTLTSIDIRPVSQNRERTFTLFSSVNGFTQGSEIGSFTESANMNAPLHTVNVTGHNGLTGQVEFRLYVHGYTDTYEAVGIGNGDGDDLIINGTTN